MKLLKNSNQLKKLKERRRIFLTKGKKIIVGELFFEEGAPIVESTSGRFNMEERFFSSWDKVEVEPQVGGAK